jgi:uncharacterized membrane protein YkgB
MFMKFNFQINQSFARVYAVGASLAVVLWSMSILRGGALWRGLGIYGCLVGAVTAVGTLSGLLTPDWHGFTMLIFAQAIWFVAVGWELWKQQKAAGVTT